METHKERGAMDNQVTGQVKNPSAEGAGMASRIAEQVGEKAERAKEAVADFGRKTVEGIEAQRTPAAAMLNQTASTLHQRADKAAGTAHATADQMDAAAEYVRSHDLKAMGRDVQQLVQRYPVGALAAAALAGFVVARAMRSRS